MEYMNEGWHPISRLFQQGFSHTRMMSLRLWKNVCYGTSFNADRISPSRMSTLGEQRWICWAIRCSSVTMRLLWNHFMHLYAQFQLDNRTGMESINGHHILANSNVLALYILQLCTFLWIFVPMCMYIYTSICLLTDGNVLTSSPQQRWKNISVTYTYRSIWYVCSDIWISMYACMPVLLLFHINTSKLLKCKNILFLLRFFSINESDSFTSPCT